MEGISPLRGQQAVAGLQGQLIDLYRSLFQANIYICRFDSLSGQRRVRNLPYNRRFRIRRRPFQINLAVYMAFYLLYRHGGQLQDAGNIAVANAGLSAHPTVFRTVQQVRIVRAAALVKVQIRQAHQLVIIRKITTYVRQLHAVDRKRIGPQRASGRRVVRRAANMGADVEHAAPRQAAARHHAGNIQFLPFNIQVQGLADRALYGYGRIVRRNIAVRNIKDAVIQSIIGADIFI